MYADCKLGEMGCLFPKKVSCFQKSPCCHQQYADVDNMLRPASYLATLHAIIYPFPVTYVWFNACILYPANILCIPVSFPKLVCILCFKCPRTWKATCFRPRESWMPAYNFKVILWHTWLWEQLQPYLAFGFPVASLTYKMVCLLFLKPDQLARQYLNGRALLE
jgi:hypothetical protein